MLILRRVAFMVGAVLFIGGIGALFSLEGGVAATGIVVMLMASSNDL